MSTYCKILVDIIRAALIRSLSEFEDPPIFQLVTICTIGSAEDDLLY